MQTMHAWGLPSSRLGNNDFKKKKKAESKSAKGEQRKKRQKISKFYKEGTKVQ